MADEGFLEPHLIDHTDPSARPDLERLGRETWAAALDWLYGPASERPIAPEPYRDARRNFFGESDRPAAAPAHPTRSEDVLREFSERVAPSVFAAQHSGAFSYFTPPPLPMSIAGEVLAQWVHQGVDVWHAGPVAAFVEEEVTAWLREIVGMGEGSWGVLTSGGVMANVMGLTVARDVHLAGRPSTGCACTRRIRRTSRSHGRWTCSVSRRRPCTWSHPTSVSACWPIPSRKR